MGSPEKGNSEDLTKVLGGAPERVTKDLPRRELQITIIVWKGCSEPLKRGVPEKGRSLKREGKGESLQIELFNMR